MEYSSAIWDPYTCDLIYQIEAVQRRAVRFVTNNYDRRASVTNMIKNTNWATVAQRRKIARLSIFQKAHQSYLSIPIEHCYGPTLHQKILHPSLHRTPYIKRLFQILIYTKNIKRLEQFTRINRHYLKLFKQQITSLQWLTLSLRTHTQPGSPYTTSGVDLLPIKIKIKKSKQWLNYISFPLVPKRN